MGAFVISKRFNDQYKFVFTSRKGKAIFSSFGYELKFECEEAIEIFKANLGSVTYAKQKSPGGKYFFKLLIDDAFFAISRKYSTELRMQKGIDEIGEWAHKSEVLDFCENNFIFD